MRKRKILFLPVLVFLVIFSVSCNDDVEITILQTSDLHHHANGYGPSSDYTPGRRRDRDSVVGGYARIATIIKRERMLKGKDNVLVVDSGDFLMGTTCDMTMAEAPLALAFFGLMQYDAVTLGNHEFDYGPVQLAGILNLGINNPDIPFNTSIIASNMQNTDGTGLDLLSTGDSKIIFDKKVVTKGGIKIGVLGIIGKEADSYAQMAKPVTFDHDYTNSLQKMVNELRDPDNNPETDDGVQIVLLLSHEGFKLDSEGNAIGPDAELAKTVTGIDLIASGHLHLKINAAKPIGSDTILFSPGQYGEYLGKLKIIYSEEENKITGYCFKNIAVTDKIKGDPIVQAVINKTSAALEIELLPAFNQIFPEADQVLMYPIGYTDMDFSISEIEPQESGLGNLCADAYRGTANGLINKLVSGYAASNNVDITTAINNLTAAGYDLTPYTLSLIGTGTIRDAVQQGFSGVINFTDIYNLLPLGASPWDSSMPGYPLMTAYMSGADIKKLCAMQLLVHYSQNSAAPISGTYFLNFSGIRFTYSAGGMQELNNSAAAAKSAKNSLTEKVKEIAAIAMTPPGNAAALAAFSVFNSDDLAASAVKLGELANTGNTYAIEILTAIGNLNNAVNELNINAIAAITSIYPYKPDDVTCSQNTEDTALVDTERYRLVTDLYAVMMIDAAENEFGLALTVFKSKTGDVLPELGAGLLNNRVDADPATPDTIEELKAWSAAMLFIDNVFPLNNIIFNTSDIYGENGSGMGRSVVVQ